MAIGFLQTRSLDRGFTSPGWAQQLVTSPAAVLSRQRTCQPLARETIHDPHNSRVIGSEYESCRVAESSLYVPGMYLRRSHREKSAVERNATAIAETIARHSSGGSGTDDGRKGY